MISFAHTRKSWPPWHHIRSNTTQLAGHDIVAASHTAAVGTAAAARPTLPTPYACRSVRCLLERGEQPWLHGNQLAPFVRRYAQAWALLPARPR